MKINKVKLVVGTLAVLAVASTVGSISGTVAWWQNSYRATAELEGTTVRSTEVLEIEDADGNWSTNLTVANITGLIHKKNSDKNDQNVSPITYPGKGKNVALTPATDFYGHPSYQHGPYAEWVKTTGTEYLQFDLNFRVRQVGTASTLSETDYKLYLSDLTIAKKDVDGKGDISRGVRVHIAEATGEKYALLANGADGSTTEVSTVTHGNLDLNKDGKIDTTAKDYSFAAAGSAIDYGAADSTQTAYNALSTTNGVYPTNFNNGKATGGYFFGTVGTAALKLTVTIFLEGWQKLAETDTVNVGDPASKDHALWNEVTTVGTMFNIGMTFDAALANA